MPRIWDGEEIRIISLCIEKQKKAKGSGTPTIHYLFI